MNQSITLETDFCIVGGGLSGVCAALAAARNGASVILIQNRSVLGGNSSSEIRMHIVGANFRRPGARESGIIEELRLEDAVRNPQRSPSMWDVLLYEKIKAEPNITLLLDTECTGCKVEEHDGQRRIVSLAALRNSTEDVFEIRAKFFADCSGDGRLGLEAGADFRMGREAESEFGESLAPPVADNKTLGSTILFMARRHEHPVPFIPPSWARKFTKEDLANRGCGGTYEYCFWWIEWGGELDTIKDNETIRHELYRIALGVWDYIKNSGDHPHSANWALDWIGSLPGKRESRRFLGDHVLTEQDVRTGRIFVDQVAFGGWPIDLHPTRGVDAVEEKACSHTYLPHLYSIPLRSLSSCNVSNLLFAGRNSSATHVAFASTRVMATCALMGQAIGTAAAVGLKAAPSAETVAQLAAAPHIEAIQQTLLKDDALLLGIPNRDDCDLARHATITASDSAFPPENLTDGIARELKSDWGPWSDDGNHQWRSTSLPAWIELHWPEPVAVGEIHLTFDSRFDRILILTFSESANEGVIRGPQPELVKDYRILGDGKVLLEVTDNWQRKRIHPLPETRKIQTLRIEIATTHGIPEARIYEVRVY
jgi:FAD dependent oxidoreductase